MSFHIDIQYNNLKLWGIKERLFLIHSTYFVIPLFENKGLITEYRYIFSILENKQQSKDYLKKKKNQKMILKDL